jgi:hypothetical protein
LHSLSTQVPSSSADWKTGSFRKGRFCYAQQRNFALRGGRRGVAAAMALSRAFGPQQAPAVIADPHRVRPLDVAHHLTPANTQTSRRIGVTISDVTMPANVRKEVSRHVTTE